MPGRRCGWWTLLDGLVEAFFAEVNDRLRTSAEKTSADWEIASSGPSWRAELHRIARAFAATVHTHPEILLVVATRPLSVPVAGAPRRCSNSPSTSLRYAAGPASTTPRR
ncbi:MULTISPECIES: hypothetical protein [Streptomyces]|uniref:Uncharacterized protein n=1 Tax=Streptomyces nymphaeiformis TaxID=2663842 RepID=A0A7W7TYS6_9ACTN|nr:hypothetical protein [Streptomyces nymphaeiformis]MBB4980997.1 hypothetical protein [Streptomyces nymphaeiformis]